MGRIRTNKIKNMMDIMDMFVETRIFHSVENKLCKSEDYKELKQKGDEIKGKLEGKLTEEQKETLEEYCESSLELAELREKYIYRRGIIDAFRIKDILIGSSQ